MTKRKSSGGDGIDLKKRQRSPLSPNFYVYEKYNKKKFGDNSDRKNDP
ncbi:hypothetical protein [Paenibacillus sp.]|jgi:hypothetical protein|nr:hypothetical protein [Paenibacillus sp.]MDR0268293.1 hypothetical protein [Paenibacillus sp.]